MERRLASPKLEPEPRDKHAHGVGVDLGALRGPGVVRDGSSGDGVWCPADEDFQDGKLPRGQGERLSTSDDFVLAGIDGDVAKATLAPRRRRRTP